MIIKLVNIEYRFDYYCKKNNLFFCLRDKKLLLKHIRDEYRNGYDKAYALNYKKKKEKEKS